MNLKDIFQIDDITHYESYLRENDPHYLERIAMLNEAASIFQSNKKLSALSVEERGVFLGLNSVKHSNYKFNANLFGAPGGNGEVKSIISSKYTYFDDFFAAIPRNGIVTKQQYENLVDLFARSISESGCAKFPFVLFTRVLAVTRPDTFVSAAAKALEPICKALGVKNVKDTNSYWNILLPALQSYDLFSKSIGNSKSQNAALIDGVVWVDSNRRGETIVSDNIKAYSKSCNETKSMCKEPINQILYGPPGTGKTYKLQQLQSNYTNDNEVAGHEQWLFAKIENLSWMETIALILLDLGEATKVAQIIRHEFFQKKALINGRTIESLNATAWSSLQKFTIPESETVNYKNRSEPAIFDKTPDSKWLIVEDKKALVSELISLQKEIKTGPSEVEPVKRYTSITFHQSYGYEEFIEGLRANSTEDGAISYSIEAGEFIKLCRRAEQDPTNQYAIFIDEINRGNISKIFGELITLIEVDKRADCKHAMSVNLAYSGRSFSVPANVDIIGTMNTADRSLAMMDTALRRRFDFIEMMPKPELFNNKQIKGIDLTRLLNALNKRIEALYDREHTLGHAFLFPAYNEPDEGKAFELLKAAFKNKIIPLLEEYFYDDWNKIRLVLGDNQKSDELRFVEEHNEPYDSLFGSNHGLETYEESKTRYTLMAFDGENSVWDNPQAYIAVYASIK